MKYIYLILCLFFTSVAFGQASGDFRSFASGNWNAAGSWETFNGATWVAAGAGPTSANGVITIRSGHTITVTAVLTTDQTVIQSGGIVTINAGVTVTTGPAAGDDINVNSGGVLNVNGTVQMVLGLGGVNNRIRVDGTVNNNGTWSNTSAVKLIYQAGSNYFHLFDGTAPNAIPAAAWNATSTVNITGFGIGGTFVPSGLLQSFGNFVWNSPNQDQFLDLAGAPAVVNGNFQIDDTGAGGFYWNQGGGANASLTVGGNLIINGGTTAFIGQTGSNGSLTITGNMTVSGGYYQFAEDVDATINIHGNLTVTGSGQLEFSAISATTNVNLTGNLTFTGGDMSVSGGIGNVNFVGASTKTFTSTLVPSGNINYSVDVLSTLSIPGSNFVGGNGTFNSAGTLLLGSTDAGGAIQTGISAGNIRIPTANRTFQSGSTISYNGTSAQFIGNGFPSAGGNVNLTIANSSGVTLSSDLSIVALRTLFLSLGNISIGTQTLTINGTVTGSGGIVGGPTSKLVIGGTGNFGTLNFAGTNQLLNFTLNRTSSGLATLGGDLTILGIFTHTAGDLVLNGHMLTISGDYIRTGGNLVVDSSASLVINGSGTMNSPSFSGAVLGTLILNRSGSNVSTGSNLTITNLNLLDGIFGGASIAISAGGTITRTDLGSLSNAPTNTTIAYNVVYNIANPTTTGFALPTNTTALNNLTISGSSTLTLGTPITVNGVLTFTGGTFNAGSNAIDLKGNLVSNSSSTLTGSLITFSGNTTITGSTPPVFGAITISGILTPSANFQINGDVVNNGTLNLGSGTTTFGGTTTISGSAVSSFNNIIISGTLTAPGGASFLNSQGIFTDNGTFNNNGSTVVFIGNSSIAGSVVPNFASISIVGTFNAPATLNVSSNFNNDGTFNEGTGTLVLNGTTIQNITGGSVTNFHNISVTNNAAPIHVESSQNLRGVLTLVGGATFDADGNANTSVFTLVSSNDGAQFNNTKTADAAIATLPAGASVTGNVTVQRYMSIEGANNTRIFRYISSAVQNAPVSQIQVTIPVTGTFTGHSSCSGCGTAPSMFIYNEPTPGTLDLGYAAFPVATNAEVLATARGYSIFERGNILPISAAGSGLWSVTGVVNSGTINFPVFFTAQSGVPNDGWNLVGNPYPSTIDWDANTVTPGAWTRTAINNAIYMTDNAAGTPPNYVSVVASYVGGASTNGGSRYIPIGQAFFVKSDGPGAPSLIANENVKAGGTQTIFFRQANPVNFLRVALNQNGMRDEAVIRFLEDATEGFDGQADAYKLKNSIFNLSSFSQDTKLAINSLPPLQCTRVVKLDVSNVTPGAYHFDFTNIESFDPAIKVLAHDAFTGNSNWVDLRANGGIDFQVTTDSASFGSERFAISFGYDNQLPVALDVNADGVCGANDSKITVNNTSTSLNYFAKVNGVAVTPVTAGNGQALSLTIDNSNLKLGDNAVTIVSQSPNCATLIYSQDVSVKVDDMYSAKSNGGTNCREGSVTLTASGAPINGSYNWYDKVDATIPIVGQNGSQFMTPSLAKTGTYYVSAVNSIGCEGQRIPVVATIVNYDDAAITLVDDKTLRSNYATGNHWFLDNQLLTDTTASLTIKSSGLYALEVKIGTCSTRDEKSLVITGLGENGSGVRAYPNPASGMYNLEIPAEKSDVDDLPVLNTLGAQIGTMKLTTQGIMKKGQFDFTSQSAGFYYIRAVSGASITVIKVIKN